MTEKFLVLILSLLLLSQAIDLDTATQINNSNYSSKIVNKNFAKIIIKRENANQQYSPLFSAVFISESNSIKLRLTLLKLSDTITCKSVFSLNNNAATFSDFTCTTSTNANYPLNNFTPEERAVLNTIRTANSVKLGKQKLYFYQGSTLLAMATSSEISEQVIRKVQNSSTWRFNNFITPAERNTLSSPDSLTYYRIDLVINNPSNQNSVLRVSPYTGTGTDNSLTVNFTFNRLGQINWITNQNQITGLTQRMTNLLRSLIANAKHISINRITNRAHFLDIVEDEIAYGTTIYDIQRLFSNSLITSGNLNQQTSQRYQTFTFLQEIYFPTSLQRFYIDASGTTKYLYFETDKFNYRTQFSIDPATSVITWSTNPWYQTAKGNLLSQRSNEELEKDNNTKKLFKKVVYMRKSTSPNMIIFLTLSSNELINVAQASNPFPQ